jgi:hypothetical protein
MSDSESSDYSDSDGVDEQEIKIVEEMKSKREKKEPTSNKVRRAKTTAPAAP